MGYWLRCASQFKPRLGFIRIGTPTGFFSQYGFPYPRWNSDEVATPIWNYEWVFYSYYNTDRVLSLLTFRFGFCT